jgi:hypothetical protein
VPKLLLKLNGAVLRELPLEKDEITVGRAPDNDLVIDSPAVSSRHCRIVRAAGEVRVEDLDSTNGTFVNGKRVLKSSLRPNDVIGLAKHALLFVDETAPPPAAAPVAEATPAPIQGAAPGTAPAPGVPRRRAEGGAGLRALRGAVGPEQHELKGISTYIGKADRAQVRIQGGGLFSRAPDLAAVIHQRPEGFVLTALEAGYPKVNGQPVAKSAPLKDGDIIECGATTLQFFIKE